MRHTDSLSNGIQTKAEVVDREASCFALNVMRLFTVCVLSASLQTERTCCVM